MGVLGKIKKFAHLVKGWTLLPYEEHSPEKVVAMKKKDAPFLVSINLFLLTNCPGSASFRHRCCLSFKRR